VEASDIIQLLSLFLLLGLSAFFSSAETALTTCNQIRIRTLADEGDKRARKVLAVTAKQGKMLSAILIGNNIVNISASSIATILAVKLFGGAGAGIATGTLTLLVLIFGEISPKTMATLKAEELSLAVAPIISWLMVILTPVIFAINALAGGFLRLLGVDPNKKEALITEDELRTLVEVSHEEGVIEQDERTMINNVVDFGDARARDIMIPRADMSMVEVNTSYQELLNLFRRERFTRFPVYEDDRDNIIGILNMKDVLLVTDPELFHIQDYMRKASYTYESKPLSELLSTMRESFVNIVIVLNEYGGAEGLVTMEDLLEEIVGEIRDEYDEDEKTLIKPLENGVYLVPGSMKLDDLNDALELSLTSKDYDSLGGLVMEQLDRLPRTGDLVRLEGVTLQVESMKKNRIGALRLTVEEPSDVSCKFNRKF
jgi:CBS domain containing-hemolysin-like protein